MHLYEFEVRITLNFENSTFKVNFNKNKKLLLQFPLCLACTRYGISCCHVAYLSTRLLIILFIEQKCQIAKSSKIKPPSYLV